MRCFLLGAFGFIGPHLEVRLRQLGHEVITEMRYWTDRYDCIINLAAVTHIRNEFDAKMIESNIVLVNEVFKRPERIIQASSCSAAHFTNPYSLTKIWSEHLAIKHGNAVALRFQNVYGPRNNKGIVWWLMQKKDGEKIKIRGPELERDYVYVDDVVDEIVRQLKPLNPKTVPNVGVFDVGTGIGTETIDLVNLYQKLSGKTFHIDVEDGGSNEPVSMVSNRSLPNFITLEEGLKKMLDA